MGTLTKVDWINPHIVVAIDAKRSDGTPLELVNLGKDEIRP
jgi:hypothetical protein